MPVKKDIIYPIFLECCEYTEDIFWENVFEALSYGTCPYGTYISKDFLCCSYKNKEFSYKIERKSPRELYNEVYTLLTKKLGILSQQEKVKKRSDFYLAENRIKDSRQDWSTIRKKNIKDLLIERYVIDMKKKHSLTPTQSKYLLSVIFICLTFKVVTSRDIEYDNGRIQTIDGIEFDDNKIFIKRDIYDIDVEFSHESLSDKKIMSENWEIFLDKLRTR
jgi:hypothetical protein